MPLTLYSVPGSANAVAKSTDRLVLVMLATKVPMRPATPAAAVPATPVQYQTLSLDCDEGKCQGARREHTVFVESYELGSNLVIHLACPRPMDMRHVERTLVTKSDTRAKSYVLRSFIARVGGCHYVAYTRKC